MVNRRKRGGGGGGGVPSGQGGQRAGPAGFVAFPKTGPAATAKRATAAPKFPTKSRKSGEVDKEAGGGVYFLHQKGQLQRENEKLHREENDSEFS